MKLPIREDSLFAILLRAPWWVSFAVAGALFGALRLVLPVEYTIAFALPFAAIGTYAAWQQLRAPSPEQLAARLESLRAMSMENFAFVLEEAWRRAGFRVARHAGAGADYELEKAGRLTLVACRRWKASRTGIDPVRELKGAARARGAAEAQYFAAGEFTAQARQFAAANAVTLVEGTELAQLLPHARAARIR